MNPVIFSPFQTTSLSKHIAQRLNYEIGVITLHDFPDKESYIKFETDVKNKDVIILNSLDQPNPKILPLLFISETAKVLGAKSVGLCAPYLSYMRQDKQFKAGEGITADYFAALLSRYFDWLVTVDPHLHRHHALNEIYTIPNTTLHAAPVISKWIIEKVKQPLLIGPDSESKQWVGEIAKTVAAPLLILEKIRHGDKAVEISTPDVTDYLHYTPVLVDDIISTGATMIETIHHLKALSMKAPTCIGVHPIFSDNAYDAILEAGAKEIISCNTIPHPSNQIDLSNIIASGIKQQLH